MAERDIGTRQIFQKLEEANGNNGIRTVVTQVDESCKMPIKIPTQGKREVEIAQKDSLGRSVVFRERVTISAVSQPILCFWKDNGVGMEY